MYDCLETMTVCHMRQCLVAWQTSKTCRKRGCHVAASHTSML